MDSSTYSGRQNPNLDLFAESFANLSVGGGSGSGSGSNNANIWVTDYPPVYPGEYVRPDVRNLRPSSSYGGENRYPASQFLPEYLATGVPAGQSRMSSSLHGHSSSYADLNPYQSRLWPSYSYGSSSGAAGLDAIDYYSASKNGNNGHLECRFDLAGRELRNGGGMPGHELRNRSGLRNQGGISQQDIEPLLLRFRGQMSSLMLDELYHSLFDALVNSCEGAHLKFLMSEIFSTSDLFVSAAFTTQGSNSIMNLIKKIKKTEHAFTLTKILSKRFYDIATHPLARNVIQKCLCIFDVGPNMVLYEQTKELFQSLAENQVGCRFLNDCISVVARDQRVELLNRVAQISDYLANNPYGNYVVQHVLEMRDSAVNVMILARLRGHFMSLARKKVGSHVVEKCLESCESGLRTVVTEILQHPQGAFQLAKDQYGNYVIQKALRLSKEQGYTDLYESLSKALRPYSWELKQTSGGKCVMNNIDHGGRLRIGSLLTEMELMNNGDYSGLQACSPIRFPLNMMP